MLRLDRPATPPANGVVRLTGVVRQLTGVVLEQRTGAGAWITVKRLAPSADGSFAVKLRPATTSVYRLSADGLGSPPLTVRVAA
jgi:hypothetical protein